MKQTENNTWRQLEENTDDYVHNIAYDCTVNYAKYGKRSLICNVRERQSEAAPRVRARRQADSGQNRNLPILTPNDDASSFAISRQRH